MLPHVSRQGHQVTDQEFDQSRFAGAVATQYGHTTALCNLHVDVTQNRGRALVGKGHVREPEHLREVARGHGHGVSMSAMMLTSADMWGSGGLDRFGVGAHAIKAGGLGKRHRKSIRGDFHTTHAGSSREVLGGLLGTCFFEGSE